MLWVIFTYDFVMIFLRFFNDLFDDFFFNDFLCFFFMMFFFNTERVLTGMLFLKYKVEKLL